MPKRKSSDSQPKLWKCGDLYLFPLSKEQDPTTEFRIFRETYPNTKICFITKPDREYQVIPHRMDAWTTRIKDVRTTLLRLFKEKSNETVYIGH